MFIKLENNQVKYLPSKYDRLVVELNEDSIKFLKELHTSLSQHFPIEHIIKNETQLSIKTNVLQKEDIFNNLAYKDHVNIIVVIEEVFTMNRLSYLSIKLHQYKKVLEEIVDLL